MIPAILKGKNLFVQASVASEKTLSHVIPTLQLINEHTPGCQALVIAPTKDLSKQISQIYQSIGEYLKISVALCVVGPATSETEWKEGAQIVLGTPGKVCDKLQKGAFSTDSVRIVILEDLDELLSRGYQDQLTELFKRFPPAAQVGLKIWENLFLTDSCFM